MGGPLDEPWVIYMPTERPSYIRTGGPWAIHGLAVDCTSVPMEDAWDDHIPMGDPWKTHGRPVGDPWEIHG